MNVKILTTSVATAALVGAIGLAYAQSANNPATSPATSDSTVQQPAPNTMAATPATPRTETNTPRDSGATTSPAPSDGTMQAPAPRADRG